VRKFIFRPYIKTAKTRIHHLNAILIHISSKSDDMTYILTFHSSGIKKIPFSQSAKSCESMNNTKLILRAELGVIGPCKVELAIIFQSLMGAEAACSETGRGPGWQ
jgi:hypothetical protein